MHMNKSILKIKEYGEVRIHLRELMEEKNISRNQLARAINSRFEVIDRWYHCNVEKIDVDILARICYVLDCNISDLISYNKVEEAETIKDEWVY